MGARNVVVFVIYNATSMAAGGTLADVVVDNVIGTTTSIAVAPSTSRLNIRATSVRFRSRTRGPCLFIVEISMLVMVLFVFDAATVADSGTTLVTSSMADYETLWQVRRTASVLANSTFFVVRSVVIVGGMVLAVSTTITVIRTVTVVADLWFSGIDR